MDADEYLLLSGIQHFAFCKRQWALSYIEMQWEENYLTYSGRVMHKNADNPFYTECRGDIIISRAVPLVSHKLRIYGIADVVEYHRSESGVAIPKRKFLWRVVPVEYKVGKKKVDDVDEVQVCAQAMCLEEMLSTKIPSGYIYYGKTRRRVEVVFDEGLRGRVEGIVRQMYDFFERGFTPAAVYEKRCCSCSLLNICLPQVSGNVKDVYSYINSVIGGK